MRTFLGGLLAALALMLLPGQGIAQGQTCAASWRAMGDFLAERFGERAVEVGLASSGAAATVFVNAETGSWTIALTRPGGPTCIVWFGIGWESVAEPAGIPG